MYIELLPKLNKTKYNLWKDLLNKANLQPDTDTTQTALLWDGDRLVATGSRQQNLLKCIAVDADYQGEDLTATVLSVLRQQAFNEGHRHLFLYTKPENNDIFSSLFFYPVAQTDRVLLMESRQNGIRDFLDVMPIAHTGSNIGAIVMNCNPFTSGHRYLIEIASKECDHLYVFVVSEDKSRFSADDRLEMVKLGTADMPKVTVFPTGPYLVSTTTFPTYFLKETEKTGQIHCLLDIEIFTKYFVPKFSISCRYVGTEPISTVTNQYNIALKEHLPKQGIALKEIPRLESAGAPISASVVRKLIDAKNVEAVKSLVPKTTFNYLKNKGLL